MPSIRMTGYLRQQIENKGRELFTKGINDATNELATDFGDRLMAEIHDKHYRPYMPKNFPEDWTEVVKGLDTEISGSVTINGVLTHATHHVTLEVNRTYKIPAVSNLTSYRSHLRKPDKFVCSFTLFNEFHTYKTKLQKITKESATFKHDLARVLSRCNTLKQFLEAWPQGESLIDPEQIRELNKPRPKREVLERVSDEVKIKLSTTLIKRTILKR